MLILLAAMMQAVLDKKWVFIEDIDRSPPDVVSIVLNSVVITLCVPRLYLPPPPPTGVSPPPSGKVRHSSPAWL